MNIMNPAIRMVCEGNYKATKIAKETKEILDNWKAPEGDISLQSMIEEMRTAFCIIQSVNFAQSTVADCVTPEVAEARKKLYIAASQFCRDQLALEEENNEN